MQKISEALQCNHIKMESNKRQDIHAARIWQNSIGKMRSCAPEILHITWYQRCTFLLMCAIAISSVLLAVRKVGIQTCTKAMSWAFVCVKSADNSFNICAHATTEWLAPTLCSFEGIIHSPFHCHCRTQQASFLIWCTLRRKTQT